MSGLGGVRVSRTFPPPERGIEVVFIERIVTSETSNPNAPQFIINATTLSVPPRLVQYVTLNEYRMKLCDWGRQTRVPMTVAWRRTPYGRDLVSVDKAK